jgi:hypothetical protein
MYPSASLLLMCAATSTREIVLFNSSCKQQQQGPLLETRQCALRHQLGNAGSFNGHAHDP